MNTPDTIAGLCSAPLPKLPSGELRGPAPRPWQAGVPGAQLFVRNA
jgi:hypothetical protein